MEIEIKSRFLRKTAYIETWGLMEIDKIRSEENKWGNTNYLIEGLCEEGDAIISVSPSHLKAVAKEYGTDSDNWIGESIEFKAVPYGKNEKGDPIYTWVLKPSNKKLAELEEYQTIPTGPR